MKQLTEEHKKKISNGMKKAHKEGRANNWQDSKYRGNGKTSYPETFIMKVIENELIDKNYVKEYSFHIYSFDFCWEHLKKYIEIDGEQHNIDYKQKERDIEKDRLAKEEGWTCLRIYWQDLFNNTQEIIKIIKDFIDEDNLDIEYANQRYKDFVKQKEIEKQNYLLNKGRTPLIKAEEIAYKVNALIDSDIDFTKFGWGVKVSKITGCSENQSRRWIKTWYPKLLEKCYTKKLIKENIDYNKTHYIFIKNKKEYIPGIKEAEEIAYKVNTLIDSDIDFTKRGCINKASKIIGCYRNYGRKWIKMWYPKLLENI